MHCLSNQSSSKQVNNDQILFAEPRSILKDTGGQGRISHPGRIGSSGSIAIGGVVSGSSMVGSGTSSAGGSVKSSPRDSIKNNSPLMNDRRRTLRPGRTTLATPSEDDAESFGRGFDVRNDGQVTRKVHNRCRTGAR